jgi:hypothetical protein
MIASNKLNKTETPPADTTSLNIASDADMCCGADNTRPTTPAASLVLVALATLLAAFVYTELAVEVAAVI